MIFYKYVTFSRLHGLLETWKLRFTQPSSLNDPFEMPAFRKAMTAWDRMMRSTALQVQAIADLNRSFGNEFGAGITEQSGKVTAESKSGSSSVSSPGGMPGAWRRSEFDPAIAGTSMPFSGTLSSGPVSSSGNLSNWPYAPASSSSISDLFGQLVPENTQWTNQSAAELKEKEELQQVAQTVDQEFGVLSLTSTRTNLLMWAHYADGHHGAVVGIETDDADFRCEDELRDSVHYQAFRLAVDAKEEVMLRHFFYKSTDWRYENEYRIVRRFSAGAERLEKADEYGNPVYLYPLPKSALKSVILGAKATGDSIETVRNLLANPGTVHVECKKAIFDEDRFGIAFEDIPRKAATVP